jgi:hypothetical protein
MRHSLSQHGTFTSLCASFSHAGRGKTKHMDLIFLSQFGSPEVANQIVREKEEEYRC